MVKEASECICWLFGLVLETPHVDRGFIEIVEELFLFICREFPDTLEAFEVDDATELEEEILDNVESVDTGDIVDVRPNPPTPAPPEKITKIKILIRLSDLQKISSNIYSTKLITRFTYLSKNLIQSHYYCDYVRVADQQTKVSTKL